MPAVASAVAPAKSAAARPPGPRPVKPNAGAAIGFCAASAPEAGNLRSIQTGDDHGSRLPRVLRKAKRSRSFTGKIRLCSTILQKAQTGDFQDGSQYGTGRAYANLPTPPPPRHPRHGTTRAFVCRTVHRFTAVAESPSRTPGTSRPGGGHAGHKNTSGIARGQPFAPGSQEESGAAKKEERVHQQHEDEESGGNVERVGGPVVRLAQEAEAQKGVVPVDGFVDGQPVGKGKGGDIQQAIGGERRKHAQRIQAAGRRIGPARMRWIRRLVSRPAARTESMASVAERRCRIKGLSTLYAVGLQHPGPKGPQPVVAVCRKATDRRPKNPPGPMGRHAATSSPSNGTPVLVASSRRSPSPAQPRKFVFS